MIGYTWMELGRETQISRNSIAYGVQEVASTRGASSHVHNPLWLFVSPMRRKNKERSMALA